MTEPRPTSRPRSLRSDLTLILGTLAVVAIVGSTSLVLIISNLHRSAKEMELALHSVRAAEQVELDLLRLGRVAEPSDRWALEGVLRDHLALARSLVSPSDAQDFIAPVEAALTTPDESGQHLGLSSAEVENGISLLDSLVERMVRQASAARLRVADGEELATWIGTGAAAATLLATAVAAWWLRARAFRPALALGKTMETFAGGEHSTRAEEQGPAEFRAMATRFNEMADTLERHERDQLAFVAGVAHDIRTPLSALAASAELLRREPNTERVQKTADVVGRQVHTLDRMVSDLLDAARAEAGQLELEVDHCDLRRVAEAVGALYKPLSPAHDLVVRVPAEPVAVKCDAQRLEQVVSNLVSNAIKYSPDGGPVELTLKEDAGGAVITVSDQGLGIPSHDLERIFESFQRGNAGRVHARGAGLGLAVCRRIVEAHSGRIEVDSQPGAGSTFRVHLPHAPSQA